eukprot:TRINITY_DN55298_c0_g1_i1.p1 TRINITY_DN55298_c0_g1~~TRINITY_DN55298_c0_g1_i1.p1  ORF type:complete len:759 (+),score=230.04 TRINITY_DN55298_c0_g1_i1:90-2279(+)
MQPGWGQPHPAAGAAPIPAPTQVPAVGTKVMVLWYGEWHQGTVAEVSGNKADILWLDGSHTLDVPPDHIRPLAPHASTAGIGSPQSQQPLHPPRGMQPLPQHPPGAAAGAFPGARSARYAAPQPAPLSANTQQLQLDDAALRLPIGPPPLRWVVLLLLWGVCIAQIVLIGTDNVDTIPVLITWIVLVAALLAQTAIERTMQDEHSSLEEAARGKGWVQRLGGERRLRPLLVERTTHKARLRRAMENIIDTWQEHLGECMHNCDNAVESSQKHFWYDTAADKLYEDNDGVPWGTVWRPLGQRMAVPPLQRLPGAPAELTVAFGDSMRQLYFSLAPGFLNGASYGATPRPVLDAQRCWIDQCQRNPIEWRFKALPFRLKQAENLFARFLSVDPDDLKLLPNANAATSSVLKSLPWRVGDRFLILNVEYDATKLAAGWLRRTHGVETVEVAVDPSMSDDGIVEAVARRLRRMKEADPPLPVVANICHVTSKTAWVFPVKRLVDLLHSFGVSVMVDGAQATGQLAFRVNDLGADWYYGTAHKWMYTAPGVGFLVTPPHKQPCTFPLTVSYFDRQGYSEEFAYTGLQDFSNWLTVIDACDFVEKVCGGWDNVRGYCHNQARECVDLLGRLWGTRPLQGGPARYGSMPIMPLPGGRGCSQADAVKVMGWLSLKHKITAFLLIAEVGGAPWLCVRCTCQIYTSTADWHRLGDAILELRGRYGGLGMVGHLTKALFT